MSETWIGARVHRQDGVAVLVPLLAGETRFVETVLPPSPSELLWLGEGAPDALPLLELLWALWPAGHDTLRQRAEVALRCDNRIDLEAALLDFVPLLQALLRWWQQDPESPRESQAAMLSRHAPRIAALLAQPLDEEPIGRLAAWPDLFLRRSVPREAPDAEDWASWSSRDEASILGERGGLRQLLGAGFEVRAGQLDMAERVHRVFERGEHLMVEAGTGIGKSLAYLVPALLHGARAGERVIVSTYTKALQEQLVDHDLPLLARLGFPGRACLLLGRNNYLCRRQLRRALSVPPQDAEAALARVALANWARQSADGRRIELAEHPWFEAHWRVFFESIEPCSPHICHPEPGCFVVRARRRARESHVVVVNHSLLMMDLKSAQSLMGPSKLLVVDEAHQLPDVALHALSRWISPERLEVYRNLAGDRPRAGQLREVLALIELEAARLGEPTQQTMARQTDAALEALLAAAREWFAKLEQCSRERLGEHHVRAGRHRIHDAMEAFGPLRAETQSWREAAATFDSELVKLLAAVSVLQERGASVDDAHEALAALLEFHRDFTQGLEFTLTGTDEDWVFWLEWSGELGLAAVVAAPLTVEAPFAQLWDEHYESVVLTSATLTVANDFTPFAESVGMSKVGRYTDSLIVPSPFEYREQSLFLTAGDLAQPNDPRFAAQVARVLAFVAQRVVTKTLVLCTSYRFIEELRAELQIALAADELLDPDSRPVAPLLLAQDAAQSRPALIERFRRADAAILLGTGSFWEGVDFPGRELELLVVPRLPFAVPTEPLVEGRFERARRLGRDPFEDVALTEAVLRLKQGIGRLLRSREDRGVVLLLDQRLQAKAYGVVFLRSLPRSCELVARVDEVGPRVVDFFQQAARVRRAHG